MSVNSVHANLEALKGWLPTLNKGKKSESPKKEKHTNTDTKAKK